MSRIHSFSGPVTTLLLLIVAAIGYVVVSYDRYKPLHLLEEKAIPSFTDDLDTRSLLQAAKRQIAYLERLPQNTTFTFGSETFGTTRLAHSAQTLVKRLQQQPDRRELTRFLQDNYLVYQAGGRKNQWGRRMLVTGYYEPVFNGSLTRKAPYLYPIYRVPDSLVVRSQGDRKEVGRYDRKRGFIPFWSRAEIETGNLLQGYELAYLRDPFDAFLLHVQGSGRIRLPDNTLKTVRFNGSNGLEYNSIGKLLVDEGIMDRKDVTIPAIREHLKDHPTQLHRILHHNPRFIFFTWGDARGPRGSSGEILTPGRSIAIDGQSLPGGTIGYLISRQPLVDNNGEISGWTGLNRFVFPQDTGAAIKGSGRVDLFWGNGDYARTAANHMKEEGRLYFLVLKRDPESGRQL